MPTLLSNMENEQWYGQWGIVLVMVAIFAWLLFRFLRPRKKREWRSSGILTAFIIALYTEMYGFPLTIYILSSVFGIDIPLTHLEGHLWSSLLGLGEAGAVIEMLFGYLIIGIGGFLVLAGWSRIYRAKDTPVTDGIYKYMRHPQYTGIILITIGMLIHWPTLITLLMWPILTLAYYGLAQKEEGELEKQFGEVYQEYKNKVPMFLPSFKILFAK